MPHQFLKKLLSIPTAPYRERFVQEAILAELKKFRVPHFLDPFRNIVVGVADERRYRQRLRQATPEPLRLFIAHTDHPGFHGTKICGRNRLAFEWYGGGPKKFLVGTRVWLCNQKGHLGEGRMSRVRLNAHGSIAAGELTVIGREFDMPLPKEVFGGLKFRKPVWQSGKVLYTKAADDLVGAAVIIELAKKLKNNRNFIGLLTRAEEVGFIGCIYHFELGWLKGTKRPVVCVSLETSRTFPGAEIGKGPIVRLGDRATCFDPNAVEVLSALAKKILKKKYQRRIMDGGTCEGTVATAYGFPTLAMSIPLGNYHNQSLQGGPDSRGKDGPAPEYVHLNDIDGMFVLGEKLCANGLNWNRPWEARVNEFRKWKKKSSKLILLR